MKIHKLHAEEPLQPARVLETSKILETPPLDCLLVLNQQLPGHLQATIKRSPSTFPRTQLIQPPAKDGGHDITLAGVRKKRSNREIRNEDTVRQPAASQRGGIKNIRAFRAAVITERTTAITVSRSRGEPPARAPSIGLLSREINSGRDNERRKTRRAGVGTEKEGCERKSEGWLAANDHRGELASRAVLTYPNGYIAAKCAGNPDSRNKFANNDLVGEDNVADLEGGVGNANFLLETC